MAETKAVPNYLVQAILCTICCCLPFGIVAIVYAAQVNGKVAGGRSRLQERQDLVLGGLRLRYRGLGHLPGDQRRDDDGSPEPGPPLIFEG